MRYLREEVVVVVVVAAVKDPKPEQ